MILSRNTFLYSLSHFEECVCGSCSTFVISFAGLMTNDYILSLVVPNLHLHAWTLVPRRLLCPMVWKLSRLMH